MLQVLVGLYAAVLRPLIVKRPGGVKKGNISISACAEVNLLQLQSVACIQVLLRVPQNPAIQSLPCRESRQRVSWNNGRKSVC